MVINNGGNVGIGTSAPAEKLHIVGGSIRIDDGTKPYTLPSSDGSIGYIMQTDGAGTVSWVDPATLSDGDWIKGTGTVYNNTDRIGVGTANPSSAAMMHISNTSSYQHSLLVNAQSTTTSFQNGIYVYMIQGSSGPANAIHTFVNANGTNIARGLSTTLDVGNTVNPTSIYGASVYFQGGSSTFNNNSYGFYANFSGLTTASGANKYGVYVTGENKNYFSSSVGIGAQSPNNALEIYQNNSISSPFFLPTIKITADNTGGLIPSIILLNFDNNSSPPVFTFGKSRGSVSSPSAVLYNDALGEISFMGETGAGSYLGAQITAMASQNFSVSQQGTSLDFKTVSNGSTTLTSKLFIAGNGNVGIGTSTPGAQLHVVGGSSRFEPSSNGYAIISPYSGTPQFLMTDGSSWTVGIRSSGPTYFNGGNVGIGTSSPTNKLTIIGSATNNAILYVKNNSTTNPKGLIIDLPNVSVGGNCGTPTTSTTDNFIEFRRNGTLLGGVFAGSPPNGVCYAQTSDRRLKTNIQDYENALSLIEKMKPRVYEWKANPGHKEVGFIAQELYEVFPQVVTGTPDGDPKTSPMMVDYGKLTPVAIQGVKELNQKLKQQQQLIEKLQAELQSLKQQNQELKAENHTIKQKLQDLDNLKAEVEHIKTYLKMESKK